MDIYYICIVFNILKKIIGPENSVSTESEYILLENDKNWLN